MFAVHAIAVVAIVTTVGFSEPQQSSSNTSPRATEAEREAALKAIANLGRSIDALNATMPPKVFEPTFGDEFRTGARHDVDRLERRMIDIDDSFDHARGKPPRRRLALPGGPDAVPTEPEPTGRQAEPTPAPREGDCASCVTPADRSCAASVGSFRGSPRCSKNR